MNDSKTRLLFIAALLGLVLIVPTLISPKPAAKPALGTNKSQAHVSAAPSAGPSAAPSPKPAAQTALNTAARGSLQKLSQIETDDFVAKVSNLNGGLTSFRLKAERYHGRGAPVDIVSTSLEEYLPLAVELDGLPSDAQSTWSAQQLSGRALMLSRDADGLLVNRKLEAGQGPYQLWLTTEIHNHGDTPRAVRLRIPTYHYVSREAEGSNVPLLPVRSAQTSNALCNHGGSLERKDRKSLTSPAEHSGAIIFSGVENVYFLSALAPDSGGVERCRIQAEDRAHQESDKPLGTLFSARLVYQQVELPPGGSKTYRTLAYLGPKSPAELNAAGHSLKETIQSGWFTTLAEGLTWLLRLIHDWVGNWGVAIILLTFLVKLVLFPLTAKQMQSMARMKELKPELDRINQLYGDDREKKGAAIMELYRKRGVNPMAGCFPVLLQLPIWFSLYASLSSNVELFRAPFALWWTDLSAPDHLFFLPLALGVLMFIQQKMSPATGVDPVQQKMMLYMMPAMITSFMLFLPAGLCLYMFTNSALSIGQQRLIEARLKSGGSKQSAGASPNQISPPQPDESAVTTTSPLEQHKAAGPGKTERRWRRGKR
jgi:YidC/Oxa1 family membrane protein insertase